MSMAQFFHERKERLMENEKMIDEPISTTGTVRDVLEELKDQDVVIVIPIGGDADEFK